MPYSKPGLSYQWRLFSVLLAMSMLLVICFVGFQYFREKQYKADILNAELQIFNTQIIDRLEEGRDLEAWLDSVKAPVEDLRVTVFTKDGRAIFDNTLDVLPTGTHLQRREIRKALEEGRAYTMRSNASLRSKVYFYSVTADPEFIVRTGAPYHSVSVGQVLEADGTFLWFMLGVSAIIGIIGYYSSRSIGQTISRLAEFARAAEQGKEVRESAKFPRDELGIIAANIVSLYNKLLAMSEERDKQQLQLIQEEEEKQKIKRDLTHNINHELKTPVASILGCAETLYEHPDLPQKIHHDFMERIMQNAKRLSSLLRDISTINRLDEASSIIEKEEVNLSGVINDMAADAAPRAEKAGMEIEIEVPDNLKVLGNQGLMESVFRNLIENAINYSGGTRLHIGIMEHGQEQYTVTVTDNGSGIPEEHFPKLFDRFYRLDKGRSRKAGGTGLGLAIVRNAVLFHGGDITVANVPTGGLEFAITLPTPDAVRAASGAYAIAGERTVGLTHN